MTDNTSPVAEFRESLLRTVIGQSALAQDAINDRLLFTSRASTVVAAFRAERLLAAMVDHLPPDVVTRIVLDVDELSADGEHEELAYQYASDAGLDPDAWAEQSRAWAARIAADIAREAGRD